MSSNMKEPAVLSATTLRSKATRLADRIIISIIISVQFLFSLLWLLSTPFAFNYGGAAAHPYGFLLWIAYWSAGIASAILLRKKGSWRRIVAGVWNSLLVGVTFVQGVVWENPTSRSFGYLAIYGIFAICYLATTAVIGRAAGQDVSPQQQKAVMQPLKPAIST